MKVLAVYLLAVLGGNTNPSADDLKRILASVGAEADEKKIELLLSSVKGKDMAELIAAGREQLGSVSSGAGVAVAAPSSGGAVDSAAAAPIVETKKEEIEEEDGEDFCFSLFD